jgi:D-proline reductase (dithiol) PrdB
MVRAANVPEHLVELPCSELDRIAATSGPPLGQRRVALISTAGLMHRGETPFGFGSADYRVIDRQDDAPLVMGHISTNFDRSGFAADANVVFPLDRLDELAAAGEIGSVARYHYSFMGATEPEQMRPAAEQLAATLAGDEVDLALLIPV